MKPLLEVRHVSKHFVSREKSLSGLLTRTSTEQRVRAVDDVSLHLEQGEVLGLVGESGCGKSTLARMVAGLMPPTVGQILLDGQDRQSLSRMQQTQAHLAIQMIFQDPMASLNPRMRVEDLIGEAPVKHHLIEPSEKHDYVAQLLEKVGLTPSVMQRYPHEFSGGQRARIGIARALAVKPRLLICDEALAALDVSIQAQILNLFLKLREDFKLTYLFVSHDLSVIQHIADRVVVMYLGRVVESAPNETKFLRPNHPYTRGLLAEIPRLDRRQQSFGVIEGEIPSPLSPPSGCHFHTRCPQAQKNCSATQPFLKPIAVAHLSACHLNNTD